MSTPLPTFSIVSVTWNNLDGLRATAASVAAQTNRDFEWIVIDGGSTDGSREWLESHAPPGCRWTSERDEGVFDAMNKGLDRCVGSYVVFLNAGDTFTHQRVLDAVRRSIDQHPSSAPDLIYGDSIDVGTDGSEYYRRARRPSWIRFGMFASHQATFFRRARAPELRHERQFPTSGDYAFIATFLATTTSVGPPQCEYLPSPLCRFTLGGMHFSGRAKGMAEDFRIRRSILGQPLWLASTLFLLHRVHQWFKLHLPTVAIRARYSRSAE